MTDRHKIDRKIDEDRQTKDEKMKRKTVDRKKEKTGGEAETKRRED